VPLDSYRRKRHFEKTPEPAGAPQSADEQESGVSGGDLGGAGRGDGLLYIIQKHAARRLHYDFRLELDGVLLSWAVPKGPSFDPHDRHLAVRVEDHPLEYGAFEGIIPKGEYGAGTVELWDRGTWEPEADAHTGLGKGDLKFILHGEKLKGSWALVRMKSRPGEEDKENWLLIKHRDEYAVNGDGQAVLRDRPRSIASGRTLEEITVDGPSSVWHSDQPATEQTEVRPAEEFQLDPSRVTGARKALKMPRFVKPQLATLADRAPAGAQWLHEIKFDGYRALSTIEKGSARIYSRNEKDWTGRYQALADQLAGLPVESAMVDGEVVVQSPDGTTSFQELQSVAEAGGYKGEGRLLYYVFDLLYLNGYELLGAAIEDRKMLLKRLLSRGAKSGRIMYSDDISGDGAVVFEQACRLGLEGVVSKRVGSLYRPGMRGADWQKVKCWHEQEFVVGGFTDPAGGRTGFGALLLGSFEEGDLRYVGKVGTGFNEESLLQLGKRLFHLEIETSPFLEQPPHTKTAHWVKPELVAEVAFSEWTRAGRLRHPSFKGLREDKPATEVIMESENAVHGVKLTHPERIFWPLPHISKRDLVGHYESVAEWMLPYVLDRPVSMVRCPDGIADAPATVGQGGAKDRACFFHKHAGSDFPGPLRRIPVEESRGSGTYLTITEAGSLTALAQMGVLEIHVWGSTWPDIEHPDMLVFDLDPDSTVEWPALADGARLMRDVLGALGLESFVKTTGGKGLHVVAPITPGEDWEGVRRFCKSVAETFVSHAPDRYTANMSKAKRGGKIYVDYVRNGRGATSIAPYSTRATQNATVAVPLRWNELRRGLRPDTYTVGNLQNRMRRLKGDPWEDYFEVGPAQTITAAMKEALGTV